jgi:hypothetical protein
MRAAAISSLASVLTSQQAKVQSVADEACRVPPDRAPSRLARRHGSRLGTSPRGGRGSLSIRPMATRQRLTSRSKLANAAAIISRFGGTSSGGGLPRRRRSIKAHSDDTSSVRPSISSSISPSLNASEAPAVTLADCPSRPHAAYRIEARPQGTPRRTARTRAPRRRLPRVEPFQATARSTSPRTAPRHRRPARRPGRSRSSP